VSAPGQSSAAHGGLANVPLRGVLLMVATVAAFSAQDASLKWLTAGFPFWQIMFFGRILAVPLALGLAWRSGGLGQIKSRRPWGHGLRAALMIATMLCFVYALKHLPIADTIAIGFAAPLFMTALSVPFLGEKVGPRRWAAVLIGFGGVMVILQPSGTGFGLAALAALSSAATYALLFIVSRKLTATESGPCLIFWNSFTMLVCAGIALPWEFRMPEGIDILVFIGTAVFGALGQLLMTEAFRYGEVSLLAPIEYSALIWATLFGWLLWNDLPSLTVIAGAAIIIASSAYILHRETRVARAKAAIPVPVAGAGPIDT
jgi:drug/metabolite transporter (DMT)-like permease